MSDQASHEGQASDCILPFLKLGLTAFGGPAAHIAMMEEEFVERRKWLTGDHFLDLVGATNLIPGPNSSEMTMHIGFQRAGWKGLVVAGTCFIVPATALTAGAAWLYLTYGQLPQVEPFLVGIKPVVVAIIAAALVKLAKRALKSWSVGLVGALVLLAVSSGFNQLLCLLGGGVLGVLALRGPKDKLAAPLAALFLARPAGAKVLATATQVTSGKLFLFFLKVGATLYGSGYVLIAFVEEGLVHQSAWLTSTQLLDAVAVGQMTPGPVLTTSTFVGYILAGPLGATAATAGIFLPSFLFSLGLTRVLPRLRESKRVAAFLDAVNVSAVALMLYVCAKLALSSLTSPLAGGLALTALFLHLRFKVTAPSLILAGALLGWIAS